MENEPETVNDEDDNKTVYKLPSKKKKPANTWLLGAHVTQKGKVMALNMGENPSEENKQILIDSYEDKSDIMFYNVQIIDRKDYKSGQTDEEMVSMAKKKMQELYEKKIDNLNGTE